MPPLAHTPKMKKQCRLNAVEKALSVHGKALAPKHKTRKK